MTKPMYEMSGDYARLLDEIYESADEGGEITDAAMQRLDGLREDITEKATSICCLLSDLTGRIETHLSEEDRLATRRKSLERHRDWLKEYLHGCLKSAHLDKIDTGLWRISIRQSPPKVEVFDIDAVPAEFDAPQERKLAVATIKLRIQAGQEVPGARLVQGTHLRIA